MALPIIERGPIHDLEHFRSFSNDVPTGGGPTPDELPPDVVVQRKVRHGDTIPLPGGREVEVWVFEDPENETDPVTFPSKTIRVREGQLVHGRMEPRHGPHTIHWHGIEPTTHNDGVGHVSFEVEEGYTYQWQAAGAGTYIYHCHRNTVLHFEMGMYGMLIIDPPQGEGFYRRINEVLPYDVEAVWVGDEMDLTWHKKDKDAGIGDFPFEREDAGLNIFNPTEWFITGVPHPWTREDPKVVVRAKVGQTVYVRIACAGYTRQRWVIGHEVEVVAMDGRTLGWEGGPGAGSTYSHPFTLAANTPIDLTTTRRWDLVIRPTQAGTYPVRLESRSISEGRPEVLGTAETFIHVDP